MQSKFITSQPDNWNSFIADSPFGDILQSWEWGDVRKGTSWQPLRLQITDQDQVIAQAQVLVRQLPLGFKLYYMPRGPVLDYAAKTAPATLAYILDVVRQHAKKNRGLLIKIGPAVSTQEVPHITEKFQQLNLKPASQSVQAKHTRVIDLQVSDSDLLGSFDKDTRNLVRRAAREGVVVDCFNSQEDTKHLRTFHNLYMATADRGDFPARPWKQMVKLWKIMAPRQMAYIYTASSQDQDQALASSLVLRLGNTAYQLWSGSRRDTGKKYPTYALQWTIMQHMKSLGVTKYDMWGVAPDDNPQHPLAGPSHFKKGFGGQHISFTGDYDLPVSPLYYAYQIAMAIRSKIVGVKPY